MPEIKPSEVESTASIKVIGVGGAGGSAIDRMKEVGLSGVELVAINTDAQALHHSNADTKVHIGRGLGAGGDPEKGREAAEESRELIGKALDGADMAFITLGAGGGTGSGAGPIVAEEAKSRDILTVGVATKPFTFEGAKRRENAEVAIENLAKNVDALITIPNDRLLQTIDPRTPLLETFKIADDVLRQGVQGISELITEHSLINLDFADVKAIMKNAGSALMGIGRASGENRATVAANQAIESPLIEVKIEGAKGVLFSVAGGYDMSMSEIQEAAEVITAAVSPDANIIFGASIRPELQTKSSSPSLPLVSTANTTVSLRLSALPNSKKKKPPKLPLVSSPRPSASRKSKRPPLPLLLLSLPRQRLLISPPTPRAISGTP